MGTKKTEGKGILIIVSGGLEALSILFWVLTILGQYPFRLGTPLFYLALSGMIISLINLLCFGRDKKWARFFLPQFIISGIIFSPFWVTALFFLLLNPLLPGIGSEFFGF